MNHTFDHNIYYRQDQTSFPEFFYEFEGSNIKTFAEWQARDYLNNANSKMMEPQFVSEDDLHLVTEEGYSFGDPAVGIEVDIDGNIRVLTDSVNVGADEMCYATAATDFITICETEFTWIDGNTYTENNDSSTFILNNEMGCDSIIILNLTFSTPTEAVDEILSCEPYTWIDGITYFSDNNTASFTLTNSQGCDSIVMLDLTVESIDTMVSIMENTITAHATDATFQWINCDSGEVLVGEDNNVFTATETGNYAVEVSQNGCTETSACIDIIVTSSIDLLFTNELQVFPNPTNGDFTVDLGELRDDFSVRIYNALGQKVKHLNFAQREKIELILEGESAVYLVEIITTNGERAVFKIFKN